MEKEKEMFLWSFILSICMLGIVIVLGWSGLYLFLESAEHKRLQLPAAIFLIMTGAAAIFLKTEIQFLMENFKEWRRNKYIKKRKDKKECPLFYPEEIPSPAACGCPRNKRGNVVHRPESCSAMDSIIDNICG